MSTREHHEKQTLIVIKSQVFYRESQVTQVELLTLLMKKVQHRVTTNKVHEAGKC